MSAPEGIHNVVASASEFAPLNRERHENSLLPDCYRTQRDDEGRAGMWRTDFRKIASK
jgi:hypothetical protein